ncbi:MAG TPA: molybdenum ABC transporter ATP-binding protein [Stellaceae bacterium]|nr:molybdenum ABC transporter ATP-binding protein [Stellaceae bacterium]
MSRIAMAHMGGGTITARFAGRLGDFDLDAGFEVPARGVTALFGPSGCGKTSLLRCIAGLQRLGTGYCAVDGEVWQDDKSFRPTHQRPLGYVFQEASLFPHLSVRRNLTYGVDKAGIPQDGIGFDTVTRLLRLSALLDRSPHNLSGGERQRVAIGRALLSQPKLLLMDEPLSALDRATKDEILPFLEDLHDSLSLPVIYVSHDIAEVERLADHLVLMEKGRVRAAGPLEELQSDPTLPLAANRDAAIILNAVVQGHDAHYGLLSLSVEGQLFIIPAPPLPPGTHRRLRIAAGDVSLARERPSLSSIANIVAVKVISAIKVGEAEMLTVLSLRRDGTGPRLLARVTRRSWDQLGLTEGAEIHAQVKSVALAPG